MPEAPDSTGTIAISLDRWPSPALVLDRESVIIAVNAAMGRCLDIPADDLLGTRFADRAVAPARLSAFLDASTEGIGEFRFSTGTGHERWLSLTVDAHATAQGRLVTAFDLTSERSMEVELDRYVDMMRNAAAYFWQMDPDLKLKSVGYHADHIGPTDDGHVDPVDGVIGGTRSMRNSGDQRTDLSFNPEAHAEQQRRLAARLPVQDYVHCIIMSDGRRVYMRASGVPVFAADGDFQGYRGISMDVTAQVEAELALRESEAQLRRSQQHLAYAQRVAAVGSAEYDFGTQYYHWSDELYRIFGRCRPTQPESFAEIDHLFFSAMVDEDRTRVAKSSALLETGIGRETVEFRVVRTDGEIRTLLSETERLSDDHVSGGRYISIIRDVTELRAAERRQRDLEQQLLHAQKLDALGTLAGGIAHDLNNTLVPIMALTKMTATRMAEGSRERSNLDMVLGASQRARDLVRQILAFSRKELPQRRHVDLADLVRQSLKMLHASLPSTIRLIEHIDEVPPVLCDPGQINQIVINLVGNAAHALKDNTGTVTVSLGADCDERTGAGVSLSVRDTGTGMDDATRSRIFEPFFTTKPVGEGSGLGLSVVHGIVAAHGGRIIAESAPGAGANFIVRLPIDHTNPATTAAAKLAS